MHSLIPIPTIITDSSFLDLQGMSAFIYFGVVLSGELLAIEIERSRESPLKFATGRIT